MKITNFIKGVFVFVLIAVMSFGAATNTKAAETKTSYLPEGWKSLYNDQGTGILKTDYQDVDVIQPRQPAPALTSLEIIDLAVDDNNEIHVVTREIGTGKAKGDVMQIDLVRYNPSGARKKTRSAATDSVAPSFGKATGRAFMPHAIKKLPRR